MRNVLLIGNGLNRCLENGRSWTELLAEISNNFFIKPNKTNLKTLDFDSMLCSAMSGKKLDAVYTGINDKLQSLDITDFKEGEPDFLASFILPQLDAVLTTNYDYNLERAFDYGLDDRVINKKKMVFQENRASTKRHTFHQGIPFYHIHGELDLKKTVCLGQMD